MSVIRCLALVALIILLGAIGCSKQAPPPPEDATEKNLRLVATAYMQYVSKNQAPPASVKDLTPVFVEMGCNPEEVVRSSRDHEPFTILWNVEEFPAITLKKVKDKTKDKTGAPRVKHCVLGYEKNGSDGLRFVAFSNAYVSEMSDADLEKAHFPANHKFK